VQINTNTILIDAIMKVSPSVIIEMNDAYFFFLLGTRLGTIIEAIMINFFIIRRCTEVHQRYCHAFIFFLLYYPFSLVTHFTSELFFSLVIHFCYTHTPTVVTLI
jgi:hypothetical protein